MSQLKHRRVWWWLACLWVLLVIYASVANISLPQAGFSFGDKINHLLAYGFLTGWFGQLLRPWSARFALMLALFAFGFFLEYVQSLLPHRWFDLRDVAANTCGILLAALLLYFGADNILNWFERRLASSQNR